MLRKIVHIDADACTGCGLCVAACHEGAIGIVEGKARLLRDDYCDGLGDCLPACPADAIAIVEREAAAYDEQAVATRTQNEDAPTAIGAPDTPPLLSWDMPAQTGTAPSRLGNWPVQIQLASAASPAFDGADILVAADCCAYACGDFHERFMRGRATLIGCPKLDSADYADKLGSIFAAHDVRSVTLARMHVPCCGGMERAVRAAIERSGKDIPLAIAVIDDRGEVR